MAEEVKKQEESKSLTRILQYSQETLVECCELLAKGKLVAMPTETVYGLGANALDADACRSIFTAKGRPLTDPLIVHVHSYEQALSLID
jgi:L-threonylcarbamoyladenylate synthase